jgi:hypothetical protein
MQRHNIFNSMTLSRRVPELLLQDPAAIAAAIQASRVTTMHFVPLPRFVLPTHAPLFFYGGKAGLMDLRSSADREGEDSTGRARDGQNQVSPQTVEGEEAAYASDALSPLRPALRRAKMFLLRF